MIRILIADDHLVVREGLQMILSLEEDFEVVGEAANGEVAVSLAETLEPDVVLMDLRMPGIGGLEAIEQILARQPGTNVNSDPAPAIVILTTYNEDELMIRGLQAGARGFLLKDTDRKTLFHTIRAAARGETLLQPDIMARLVARTERATASEVPTGPAAEQDVLTEREMQVLTAVARGDRNKEIALQLGVTERTIKAHLTNVYNKLGVDSRAAAVAIAIQRGILSQ